jgi:hypothetical protein
MPAFVPVLIVAAVTATGAIAYRAKYPDGIVVDIAEDVAQKFIEDGVPVLEGALGELGSISLQFVEGIGEALVKGVDRTYDYIRDKFIKGREPDIIAGFTIGMLTLLTGVYIWHSVKNAKDAI